MVANKAGKSSSLSGCGLDRLLLSEFAQSLVTRAHAIAVNTRLDSVSCELLLLVATTEFAHFCSALICSTFDIHDVQSLTQWLRRRVAMLPRARRHKTCKLNADAIQAIWRASKDIRLAGNAPRHAYVNAVPLLHSIFAVAGPPQWKLIAQEALLRSRDRALMRYRVSTLTIVPL